MRHGAASFLCSWGREKDGSRGGSNRHRCSTATIAMCRLNRNPRRGEKIKFYSRVMNRTRRGGGGGQKNTKKNLVSNFLPLIFFAKQILAKTFNLNIFAKNNAYCINEKKCFL